MTHFLLIALVAAAQQPQVATTAVKVDSETISGLGARNIGSAAMSGRIAALAAVAEGGRATGHARGAGRGGWEVADRGSSLNTLFHQQPWRHIGAADTSPQNPKGRLIGD